MINVRANIELFRKELMLRGMGHDRSKIKEPEVGYFNKYTPMLKKLEYGSDEYKASLDALKPALDHHYIKNRHHPEHFRNGIEDMNLVDLIEMFCDWYDASRRTKNGNMNNSIRVSCDRFNIGYQLKSIFKNSVDIIEGKSEYKVEEYPIDLCTNCKGIGCLICNYRGLIQDND